MTLHAYPSTTPRSLLTIASNSRTIMDILFKLPAEISNLAVDLLDCKTLACLRLICKEAHQIATPTFGRRYFHTLRPAFLPDCLNSLIKISENRLLRGHIKSILFASYTMRQDVSPVKQILRLHNPGFETRLLVAHSHCIQKQQHCIETNLVSLKREIERTSG